MKSKIAQKRLDFLKFAEDKKNAKLNNLRGENKHPSLPNNLGAW